MEKTYRWHKVAESTEELMMGGSPISQVRVAGKDVCIALHQGKLTGCSAKCPHAGGQMQYGRLDAIGNIVCPLHRYKFSLQNGRNTSGEGYFLKTYPIREDEDGVYIGLDITS
jgi:nitrite reductase/ring-hydroxylating ferredoxin subunit